MRNKNKLVVPCRENNGHFFTLGFSFDNNSNHNSDDDDDDNNDNNNNKKMKKKLLFCGLVDQVCPGLSQ